MRYEKGAHDEHEQGVLAAEVEPGETVTSHGRQHRRPDASNASIILRYCLATARTSRPPWLEKTSFRLDHSTNGRANQNPNVEFTLGAVLVEETKIHQIGMRVNTAKTTHARVTRLTVRRRTP